MTATSPTVWFHDAMQARRNARFVRRSKLPGWRLYHRSELRRAIKKWRLYAEAMRTVK